MQFITKNTWYEIHDKNIHDKNIHGKKCTTKNTLKEIYDKRYIWKEIHVKIPDNKFKHVRNTWQQIHGKKFMEGSTRRYIST